MGTCSIFDFQKKSDLGPGKLFAPAKNVLSAKITSLIPFKNLFFAVQKDKGGVKNNHKHLRLKQEKLHFNEQTHFKDCPGNRCT